MASPSTVCTSCLRTIQRAAARTQNGPRSLVTNSTRAYSTSPAASQQSLYLEFLAPSSRRAYAAPLKPIRQTCTIPPRPQSRSLSTATATSDSSSSQQPPPSSPHLARAILHPRTDASGNPLLISIAPRAAHRLSTIAATDKNPDLALRVTIESGGCHGFQYLMDLQDLSKKPAEEDDTVFEGDKGAKVVIDEASLELLAGSTVDYTMELIGSQFKVTGIPGATSSCGCGTSFDIKI